MSIYHHLLRMALCVFVCTTFIAAGKKQMQLTTDPGELPKGIWKGAKTSHTRYTISFCEGNQFLHIRKYGELKKAVKFKVWKDQFGTEISIIDINTGKWQGLNLLYLKSRNSLFFWEDNGESDLDMKDAMPMNFQSECPGK